MSSRRRIPPEYVDTYPRAGVGQRETPQQVIRDRAPVLELAQPGDEGESSRPLRISSTAAKPGEAGGKFPPSVLHPGPSLTQALLLYKSRSNK